jgi:hypothetical protein
MTDERRDHSRSPSHPASRAVAGNQGAANRLPVLPTCSSGSSDLRGLRPGRCEVGMALRSHPERVKCQHSAGVAGAQPMRGEFEGSPLKYFTFLGVGAQQHESDAKQRWQRHPWPHFLGAIASKREAAISPWLKRSCVSPSGPYNSPFTSSCLPRPHASVVRVDPRPGRLRAIAGRARRGNPPWLQTVLRKLKWTAQHAFYLVLPPATLLLPS